MPIHTTFVAASILITATVALFLNIPAPKYRWSDEMLVRNQIAEFLYQDQAINRSWLEIMHEGKQGKKTFDEIAGRIDFDISEPYAESFEKLSHLPSNPALPSAAQLENLLQYAHQRQEESKALTEKLRKQQFNDVSQP